MTKYTHMCSLGAIRNTKLWKMERERENINWNDFDLAATDYVGSIVIVQNARFKPKEKKRIKLNGILFIRWANNWLARCGRWPLIDLNFFDGFGSNVVEFMNGRTFFDYFLHISAPNRYENWIFEWKWERRFVTLWFYFLSEHRIGKTIQHNDHHDAHSDYFWMHRNKWERKSEWKTVDEFRILSSDPIVVIGCLWEHRLTRLFAH